MLKNSNLQVSESELLISDVPDSTPVDKSKQITIGISTNDVEKSKQIFEALQQDGKVNMPFGEQPFRFILKFKTKIKIGV